jgi:hypothetical protein
MGGGMRRMGIVVAALALLVVAGPASMAFADDPTRSRTKYDSSWQGLDQEIHPASTFDSSWQGLDEQVHPAAKFDSSWQGLDEQIHPVATSQALSTDPVPPRGGTSDTLVLALALGLGLATVIAIMAAYRRRMRLASAG